MSSKTIYFPFREDEESYVLPNKKIEYEKCELGLPIPPKHLWLGYGQTNEQYLFGKHQIKTMLEILSKSQFEITKNKRILDFGCGAGRMVRWLKPFAIENEIWGTDISSEHIYWANQYLRPPFNFLTNTTIPHLPFEDKYFDLIYAGSVFTHIDDLAEAWLLEMRRILSSDGRLFITIQEKHTMDVLNNKEIYKNSMVKKYINENELFKETKENFNMIVGMRGPRSQVFYDIDYFTNSLKTFYEVLSVNREAYGFQTGILLRKK